MALVAHRQRDAGTRPARAAGDDGVAPLERQATDGAKRRGCAHQNLT